MNVFFVYLVYWIVTGIFYLGTLTLWVKVVLLGTVNPWWSLAFLVALVMWPSFHSSVSTTRR